MYTRDNLRQLRSDQMSKPATTAPRTLAELDPDTPMDDGLALGFYDDELRRFIAPRLWHQRNSFNKATRSDAE